MFCQKQVLRGFKGFTPRQVCAGLQLEWMTHRLMFHTTHTGSIEQNSRIQGTRRGIQNDNPSPLPLDTPNLNSMGTPLSHQTQPSLSSLPPALLCLATEWVIIFISLLSHLWHLARKEGERCPCFKANSYQNFFFPSSSKGAGIGSCASQNLHSGGILQDPAKGERAIPSYSREKTKKTDVPLFA